MVNNQKTMDHLSPNTMNKLQKWDLDTLELLNDTIVNYKPDIDRHALFHKQTPTPASRVFASTPPKVFKLLTSLKKPLKTISPVKVRKTVVPFYKQHYTPNINLKVSPIPTSSIKPRSFISVLKIKEGLISALLFLILLFIVHTIWNAAKFSMMNDFDVGQNIEITYIILYLIVFKTAIKASKNL